MKRQAQSDRNARQRLSLAKVAAKFSIGKSTIFDVMEQKDKLHVYIAEHEIEDGSFRKKMRVA